MSDRIVLASGSEIRRQLLKNAGLEVDVVVPRIDEEAIRLSMSASGSPPRDIVDSLAEAKAAKVALRLRDRLVLGCDQILVHDGDILSKAPTIEAAAHQLRRLSGSTHRLLTAAVIYDADMPVWRHVAEVDLCMRQLSEAYMSEYLDRNWDEVRHSVGCYQLEHEGARFFTRIDGDYFAVLGLPLLELLSWLVGRGSVPA